MSGYQYQVSAIDRLMVALSSSDSLPVMTSTGNDLSTVLNSLSTGRGSYDMEKMNFYLNETIAGLQQLNSMELSEMVRLCSSTGTGSASCTTDGSSPRSQFNVFSPRTDAGESLFDDYGQDGPHEETESEVSEQDFDAIECTKIVSQREKKLFKTEMCLLWIEKGFCEYGSQCKFAHHMDERRTLQRHPKFKTQICRHFVQTGACPFGRRCHFRHGDERPQYSVPSTPSPVPQYVVAQPPPVNVSPRRLPIFQILARE
eukprot:TRINITY_DN1525_c2_g2_i1.p2 TRINITY_DN1525_c2_g2~~TRINITY_DN1525_c2_g2_i1.p2  ORF type:complete len:258 (+),score=24.66 TRINITY_DN1525_c2_g2_i1:385-1158(+)